MALALGSGGARGYAHIGVVEVLEERGYEIAAVAGSSMGALVGGLHAAGCLGPYAQWADRVRRGTAQFLDRKLPRSALERIAEARVRAAGRARRPPAEPAAELADDVFGALPAGLRTLDVMQLSLEAVQSMVLRYRLAGYPPDLLITVPKRAGRLMDFHRAGELIDLGRRMAEEALDRADDFPPARPDATSSES